MTELLRTFHVVPVRFSMVYSCYNGQMTHAVVYQQKYFEEQIFPQIIYSLSLSYGMTHSI